MKPIDRDDGRHWCNPGFDEPSDSPDTCPGCGAVWALVDGVWVLPEPSDGV